MWNADNRHLLPKYHGNRKKLVAWGVSNFRAANERFSFYTALNMFIDVRLCNTNFDIFCYILHPRPVHARQAKLGSTRMRMLVCVETMCWFGWLRQLGQRRIDWLSHVLRCPECELTRAKVTQVRWKLIKVVSNHAQAKKGTSLRIFFLWLFEQERLGLNQRPCELH